MIHHVIFLTSQNLRIIYKLEIDLSPDSEVSRSLIEKISSQAHFYLTLNGRTPLKAKVERGEVILRPRWCLTGHVDVSARFTGIFFPFFRVWFTFTQVADGTDFFVLFFCLRCRSKHVNCYLEFIIVFMHPSRLSRSLIRSPYQPRFENYNLNVHFDVLDWVFLY